MVPQVSSRGPPLEAPVAGFVRGQGCSDAVVQVGVAADEFVVGLARGPLELVVAGLGSFGERHGVVEVGDQPDAFAAPLQQGGEETAPADELIESVGGAEVCGRCGRGGVGSWGSPLLGPGRRWRR